MSNLPPGVPESSLPGSRSLDWIGERYPDWWSEEQVREAEAALQADHDRDREVDL